MNPPTPSVHDILTTISETKKSAYKYKANRVAYLKQNESFELKSVLQGAFNEKVKFELPEGEPPEHKKGTRVPFKNSLSQFAELLKPQKKMVREAAFLKILAGCDENETKIIVAIKDKTLYSLYPGIYLEIAKEAFPKLF
jgi:hypothetical protein